mmetsp:Transcript_114849/g.228548  ORF Transcript_114849/g.228548 Transcript_114849/m.228548 type:complete len:237 (-) Transcript_114849:1220-1930(-)
MAELHSARMTSSCIRGTGGTQKIHPPPQHASDNLALGKPSGRHHTRPLFQGSVAAAAPPLLRAQSCASRAQQLCSSTLGTPAPLHPPQAAIEQIWPCNPSSTSHGCKQDALSSILQRSRYSKWSKTLGQWRNARSCPQQRQPQAIVASHDGVVVHEHGSEISSASRWPRISSCEALPGDKELSRNLELDPRVVVAQDWEVFVPIPWLSAKVGVLNLNLQHWMYEQPCLLIAKASTS